MNVPIGQLKPNPTNPRVLRDDKFAKLKASLQSFPDMLNKRPIVAVTDTDGKLMVLGGNMRLRACMDLKLKEVPVILADEWTEELAWVKRDKMDMDGKLRILPKEKVKEGIGRSPDFSDVLMMRMVFELRPQLVGSDYLRRKGRRFHREDVREAFKEHFSKYKRP